MGKRRSRPRVGRTPGMQAAPVVAGDVPVAAIQQGRERERVTMIKASPAGAGMQRERQRERQREKRETGRDRAKSAREEPAMLPKPPPPRASGSQTERQRGATPKTRRESALAQVCSLPLPPSLPPSRSLCFLFCVCRLHTVPRGVAGLARQQLRALPRAAAANGLQNSVRTRGREPAP